MGDGFVKPRSPLSPELPELPELPRNHEILT
jgi:hypothetical protein